MKGLPSNRKRAECKFKVKLRFEGMMTELEGLQDVKSDMQITSPQVNVEIDRDSAPALSVATQQIEDAFFAAYGSWQISNISIPTHFIYVVDYSRTSPGFMLSYP
jgi:HAE1 family hydrophobic/amphiphilic exporter-1